MITGRALLLVGLGVGYGAPSSGQEVSLSALLATADVANPQIAAARRTAEAAAARVPQAGALPDPMVGLGFMNVPVADPGLGNDEMTMAQLRVEAGFPWPGKLRLGEHVAQFEAEAAAWEVERARQEVRADVETTYYQIYFLDRAVEVAGRNESLLADLTRLTSSRYAVGRAAQPDVLEAQVERTRLLDQLVALTQQRVSAVARLNALLARATDTPLATVALPDRVRSAALDGVPGGARFASTTLADVLPPRGTDGATRGDGTLPPVAELQRLALERNPMVRAHGSRVEAQRGVLALAERAKLPDFSVSAGYSHRAGLGDMFDVMVSAPLPIFSGRKQSQGVVEQGAMLAQHEARHHAMVYEMNGEIASLHAELGRIQDQLVLLSDGILPQARTGLEASTASYWVGRVDFLALLDAQAALYRHELDYHRLLADFATSVTALERAVGAEVLP
jgi:outer membrane protein TolC